MTNFLDKEYNFYKIFLILTLIALWSSAFWSATLAVFLYKKISLARELDPRAFYIYSKRIWAFVCVFAPVMLFLVVFNIFGIKYSLNNNKFEFEANKLRYVLLFSGLEGLPFIASIFVTLISSIKKIRVIRQFDLSDFVEVHPWKLLRFPLGQALIFLPSLICRSLYLVSPYQSLILSSIRLFGYDLAGFINALVYGNQIKNLVSRKNSLVEPKMFPQGFNTRSTTAMGHDEIDYISLDEENGDM